MQEGEAGCLSCVTCRKIGGGFESKLLRSRSLDFAVSLRKIGYVAGEMVQWVEGFAAVAGNLSQIPETHVL